ncbi:SAM-dependent methyltransferase [Alphaproteobacteria bacterium]|nr:SAM-dependent methyltransferase [Alphaproteobacteria bacterium]
MIAQPKRSSELTASAAETPLLNQIKEIIRTQGIIPLTSYMQLCLTHPQHGFYRQPTPFGKAGHFTTAPEICQIFGEIVGIWLASKWMELGQPEAINLVELGPGRGTLMSDLLRGTKHIKGLHDAITIHYVDINETQRSPQKDAAIPHINVQKIHWQERMEDMCTQLSDTPTFMIGNEFLDCLPLHQAVWKDGQWYSRCVGLDHADNLVFTYGPPCAGPKLLPQKMMPLKKTLPIYEHLPDLERVLTLLGTALKKRGGGYAADGLWIYCPSLQGYFSSDLAPSTHFTTGKTWRCRSHGACGFSSCSRQDLPFRTVLYFR